MSVRSAAAAAGAAGAGAPGPGDAGTAGRADAPPPSFLGTAGDRWRKLTDACGRAGGGARLPPCGSRVPAAKFGVRRRGWRRGAELRRRGAWLRGWRGPHVGPGRSPSAGAALAPRLGSFVSRLSECLSASASPTWLCVSLESLCLFPRVVSVRWWCYPGNGLPECSHRPTGAYVRVSQVCAPTCM